MQANEDRIEAKMGAKVDDKFVKAPMKSGGKALKKGGTAGSPASGVIPDNGDKKYETTFHASDAKAKNKEMKTGGKVDEARMEKKFMKDDAKADKKQNAALEKKIEKKDDKDDARTMRKADRKERDEPKMKKGGDVKDHKYGKKSHHYANGGSVEGYKCMPKMMSDMGKVNKERDE